ncbi:MAG: hypothetical protein V4617_02935 [Gemmatimonadota bacterium]
MRTILSVALLTLLSVHQAAAQSRLPTDGGTTKSLGQPGPWAWSIGLAAGYRGEPDDLVGVGESRVGVYHELFSRALGVGGLQSELYSQSRNENYAAGVRLRFVSQVTGIAVGADYSLKDSRLRPIFTYVHPIRRGGLFADGSVLRVDMVTGPQHTFTVGFEKPILRRIRMGTTRPREDVARLPTTRASAKGRPPLPTRIMPAVAIARDAAQGIQQLAVPWLEHEGTNSARSDRQVTDRLKVLQQLTSSSGAGRNIDRETVRFHDAVDLAFSLALGNASDGSTGATTPAGQRIGARARAILLTEVLLPYDRLLGQIKRDDSTVGLGELARGALIRWMQVDERVPTASVAPVAAVFDAVLDMVEQSRAASVRETGTSRFVWIPLQFGLRAEQYDTQAELDDIVELATRASFTENNVVSYVINDEFQYQLSRTIREAKSYHVLWTHDFRGHNVAGKPDEMGYRHVLRSYLAALTARVRAYDSTGTFPTYVIILDEWFYEVNNGRLWMNLLEDPTRHVVKLDRRFAAWEDSLRIAQQELRAAIDRSVLLSSHRRQYGDAWLRDLVKVQVNITNASDPSFWSWNVIRGFPLPDTWLRDHRKIVFYDITESDPFAGGAIFTGAGVGEHYASDFWEDRSILVRGPVLLSLKRAARDLLLKQGTKVADIPAVLEPRDLPRDYYAKVAAGPAPGVLGLRAVGLQNGTGFDDKQVNVAKAVLYTLMPAGSVIKIPDSLWNGTFWGSALVGAALRGVRVIVVAPSLANAPARMFGSMVRSRELLWRLLTASNLLRAEIAASGGLLKVGIYNSALPVSDNEGRLRAINTTMAKHAWLRDLFAFPPSVYTGLVQLSAELDAKAAAAANGSGGSAVPRSNGFASEGRTLLHLKANYFASSEAWRVMARPEWVDVMSDFVQERIDETGRKSARLDVLPAASDTGLRLGDAVVRRWHDETPESARRKVIFYTVLGSSNQNDRSMVSDGEAGLLLANWPAVIPYLDMLTLIGQSEWIETPEELERLLPRQGALQTGIAHWFKFVF